MGKSMEATSDYSSVSEESEAKVGGTIMCFAIAFLLVDSSCDAHIAFHGWTVGKIEISIHPITERNNEMNLGGFSWRRFVGISAAKSRISRAIGIPLTRSGRQQKIGRMVTGGGCLIIAGFGFLTSTVIAVVAVKCISLFA